MAAYGIERESEWKNKSPQRSYSETKIDSEIKDGTGAGTIEPYSKKR